MTLSPADEFRHETGPDPRWQETYWFSAGDPLTHCGIDVHLACQPHEGYVEAQITVISPEETVSLGGRSSAHRLRQQIRRRLALPHPPQRP
ncbi:hypothetical protein, partial [Streptomyces spectabilis]|uniref:hypothetical protein n=1 Tax=Streptomyces spectabilis TaxID=68270 RepID=UPI0033E828C0